MINHPNRSRTFKKGQKVAILNRSMNGNIIFEGWATITSLNSHHGDYANVRFEGERGVVQRYIDHRAQKDPEQYAASLNAELAAARSQQAE
jgi:hypothetical protein